MFLPYALQVLFQLYGSFWVIRNHHYVIKHQYSFYSFYDFLDTIALSLSVILLVLSLIKIKQYDKRLRNNYAEIEDYSLSWINKLITFIVIVWILFAIPLLYELVTGFSPINMYYPLWIASTVLIYWIGYSTYFKQRSTPVILYDQLNTSEKVTLSSNTTVYHEKLLLLMEEEQAYLDQNLNLKSLAEKLDLSSGYLSQIINTYEDKNFFEFVNNYRVEAVKDKINDPAFAHLNLLGIAYESGFKSKSTFNLVFKKLTGKTPTAFKKSISLEKTS